VKPSTTDVAQLLLMEFALVYANDWFLLPFRFPAGTLARIDGMAVTNNFGERFWIVAAGKGNEDNWHRWAMFDLTAKPATEGAADTSLFIPPTVAQSLDGDPLEEIELARDEVANMVWAIERTVPSVTGLGRAGKDEARETLQYHQALVARRRQHSSAVSGRHRLSGDDQRSRALCSICAGSCARVGARDPTPAQPHVAHH
jgi:hypothetical protein